MEENNNQNPEMVMRDNDELVRCKQQYAYLQADFDNYRKRMEAQRGQWAQAAQADVLTQLLEIVDDFDRAHSLKGTWKAFIRINAFCCLFF